MKDLMIGAAQVDITPPIGTPLTGYILREGFSTGIHDPLFAKALVLEHAGVQIAILSCDLLGLDSAYVAHVRETVQAATEMPGDHVMLACTHTHAGPPSIFLQDCGEMEPGWRDFLLDRLVTATRLAVERRQPATACVAMDHVTQGVHNRRNPGDVIDPELSVVQFVDEKGEPLTTILNYACHPTCLHVDNLSISADYPGIATANIQQSTAAMALFLNGAIGNVGPETRGYTSANRLGTLLAHEVRRMCQQHSPIESTPLYVAARTLHLPLQSLPRIEDLQQEINLQHKLARDWRDAQQPGQAKFHIALRHWAERTLHEMQTGHVVDTVPAEVQAIRIGDIAFVGIPGELFVELGLRIKQAADPIRTMVCGFANGNIGYIPTRNAYAHGGYEIDEAYRFYGYPSVLAAEAGEMIVETGMEILSNLYA